MKRKYAVLILVVTMLGLLVGGCNVLSAVGAAQVENTPVPTPLPTGLIAEGRLMPQDFTYLSFPAGGKVAEVLVTTGQDVAKDTVLARIEGREALDAAVTAANLEMLQAQQALEDLNEYAASAGKQASETLVTANKAVIDAKKALDDLDTDDFRQRLDDAEIEVQDMQDALDDAQTEADKYANLDPDNSTRKNADNQLETAQQNYDNAVHDRDVLQNQIDSARSLLALTEAQQADAQREADARQDGPDAKELSLAESRLENAKAQLAAAQKALDQLEIKAPYDGTVVDLDMTANEPVPAGQKLITFADQSAWYVETQDLTEMDVVKVSVGEKVRVTPDALPDLTLDGVVESIDNAYQERSGDILYTVRIRLNEVDERLRWGMTVSVEFED